MIEVEHRKVPDIAAEFGCTTANIYAVVAKLRRQAAERAQEDRPAQVPLALDEEQAADAGVSAIGDGATPAPAAMARASEPLPVAAPPPAQDRTVVAFEPPSEVKPPRNETKPVAPDTSVDMLQRRGGSRPVGAKLAKPGVGLVMRTADGEETLTPFRSLDDLLSAVKPILRATAKSSEPVWFSLQPVDLSTIDVEAA